MSGTGHSIHLILTFCTCGLWAPVWFLHWLLTRSKTVTKIPVEQQGQYPPQQQAPFPAAQYSPAPYPPQIPPGYPQQTWPPAPPQLPQQQPYRPQPGQQWPPPPPR